MKTSVETNYSKRFEAFYNTYLYNVQFFAYKYTGDRTEAGSIAQDAFTVLWEKRHEIDYTKDVLPFLLTVTKHKCLNLKKREKYYQGFIEHNAYANELSNATSHKLTTSGIQLKELEGILIASMRAMSDKVRETYLLSKVHNLKNREIAVEQSIGLSTVEFRLTCAYKILRKNFDDYL